MKILSVVGARPQFVKIAPLHAAVLAAGHEHRLIHTGQHYDPELSHNFFRELGLVPDADLEVGSAARDEQLRRIHERLRPVLAEVRPDRVLVVGDTNSTLAGARAAAEAGVVLAHVESGLRCGDVTMPEERNRMETDHLADLLMCPTEAAAAVVCAEGLRGTPHVVGDVMLDALEAARPDLTPAIARGLGLDPGTYLLVTLHREANMTPARVAGLIEALIELDEPTVFPAHPRARALLADVTVPDKIRVIDPVGALEALALQANARLVVTDSGGMQKEAYWLGVGCVTLRDRTEWTETVDAGWNVLAGIEPKSIVRAVRGSVKPLARPPLYGTPGAAARIVDLL